MTLKAKTQQAIREGWNKPYQLGNNTYEWRIDPDNGFITSDVEGAFNSSKKQALIHLLQTKPLCITESCRALGVSRETFYQHKEADKAFRDAVDSLTSEAVDEIEQASFQYALEKENSSDRKFILMNWRRNRYGNFDKSNQQPVINIAINSNKVDSYLDRQNVIEAELVTDQDVSNRVKRTETAFPAIQGIGLASSGQTGLESHARGLSVDAGGPVPGAFAPDAITGSEQGEQRDKQA